MTQNTNPPLALAFRPPVPVTRQEGVVQKETVRAANRIAVVGDVARISLDEMTNTYVTAEKLAVEALATAHWLTSTLPQSDASHAVTKTLTQQFLQRLVSATDTANHAIMHRMSESFK